MGRTFLISTAVANTATQITLDSASLGGTDLTGLGIVTGTQNGDTYEIVACDTLRSAFGGVGEKGVLAGASSGAADWVQLWIGGQWVRFYLSTSGSGNWRRNDSDAISDNVPIPPDTGVLYVRLAATPMKLVLMGQVPSVQRSTTVANSGTTFLSSFWPSSLTLGTSNIESIPGWVSAASPGAADLVHMLVSGGWRSYFHDGIIWRRVGPNIPSEDIPIPTGSAMILIKQGAAPGSSELTQAVPYDLD